MVTRRPVDFSHGRNSILCPHFPNSNRIISFADPHLLNPFASYRYKKPGGRGHSRVGFRNVLLTPLDATLTNMPLSVDSKRLTEKAKSFRCNTYKKPGEGAHPSSQTFFWPLAPTSSPILTSLHRYLLTSLLPARRHLNVPTFQRSNVPTFRPSHAGGGFTHAISAKMV